MGAEVCCGVGSMSLYSTRDHVLTERSAYNATMGAIIPKIRFAVAASPFPVPRFLVWNSSGVIAYKTPYMICGTCYRAEVDHLI